MIKLCLCDCDDGDADNDGHDDHSYDFVWRIIRCTGIH